MMQHLFFSMILAMFVVLAESTTTVLHLGTAMAATPVIAAIPFVPPTTITVNMYRLNAVGGKYQPEYQCQNGDKVWGCSAYCSDVPNQCTNPSLGAGYPFAGSTVSVEIDGTAAANRYLRDVVPAEMGPMALYDSTALQAQAIAARTYAYWFVRHPMVQYVYDIDNSANKQAFIPFKYDTLTTAEQSTIERAVQDRYYLSAASDDEPIFAEYSADAYLSTLAGSFPYLASVADPISYDPAILDILAATGAHRRGLSQNGASRWARGSSSYQPPPAGARWAVSWPNRYQILAHYYTGIHVRDANNGNAVLTPPRRFNVLSVNGGPASTLMCATAPVYVTVRLQNTGSEAWPPYQVGIGYCWGGICEAHGSFLGAGGGRARRRVAG